jgi:hypothetical protein
LTGLKKAGVVQNTKYTWIELDLIRRTDDFRPESFSPADYKFNDLVVGEHIGTQHNWHHRKEYCLKNVYTNLRQLVQDSRDPRNTSLAVFKPTVITKFEVQEDTSDWKEVWSKLQNQLSLFNDGSEPKKAFPKVPFKFYYKFQDDEGVNARLMIEDWEIGALYWNCLRNSGGNPAQAIEKVKEKYDSLFRTEKEIYLFLGTTKEWHRRRARNPFVITGVFYPKKELQLSIF